MKKKKISLLIASFMAFSLMSSPLMMQVKAEDQPGIENRQSKDNLVTISSFKVSEKKIETDDNFNVDLELENFDKVTNVQIEVNSEEFYITGRGGIFKVTDSSPKIPLTYKGNGGSGKIPIKITYDLKAGGSGVTNTYISVNTESGQVHRSSSSSSSGSSYKPSVRITNSRIPEVVAGEKFDLKLELENNTDRSARNIVITPDLSGDSPFMFSGMTQDKTLEKLIKTRERTVTLPLKVKPGAVAKTYPLTIKFKFENSSGSTFEETQIVYVKVKEGNYIPKINVNNITVNPSTIKAGTTSKLTFDLQNTGRLDAKDVKASLTGLSSDKFSLNSGENIKKVGVMKGASSKKGVSFDIYANEKMTTGSYPVKIKVDYTDNNGNTNSVEHEIYVRVEGKSDISSNLIIEKVISPNHGVTEGQAFTVKAIIKNTSNSTVKDFVVKADGGEKVVPRSQNIITIREMKPGTSRTIEFSMQGVDGAESKNYPIAIEVSKLNAAEGANTIKQYGGVYIQSKDDKNSSKPKVIINNYAINPNEVKSGEDFNVSVSFLNTNGAKNVKNLKITFGGGSEQGGAVFIPVGSSNSTFVSNISPGQTVSKGIKLHTDSSAETKIYNLNVELEYEYSDGKENKEAKATETIAVPVKQNSTVKLSEIPKEIQGFVGQPLDFKAVQVFNLGKVELSNAMFSVEGDFNVEDNNLFVGNVKPGTNEFFEPTITPKKEGKAEGAIVFEYTDATGKTQKVSRKISVNVAGAPPMPKDMPPMGEQVQAKKGPNKFVIGGIIAAIAGAIFIVIRKRKQKKKEMEYYE